MPTFTFTIDEKNEVYVFLRSAIGNRLKGPDKQLNQVLMIKKLTIRGIAVHHAGMLPLLKEVCIWILSISE